MASKASNLISPPVRLEGTGIRRSDLRIAAALLASILLYGAAMYGLSGVSAAQLASVGGLFGWAALAGASATTLAYLALCIWRPAARGEAAMRLFWLAVGAAMAGLTFPAFGMFKQFVLPSRGFVWDTTLAHVGRALLGGTSPWVLTHRLFGSVEGTRFLNLLYSFWLVAVFLFPMLSGAFVGDRRLRLRMLVSWWGAWLIIGTVAAWCLASAGPCYYNRLIGPDPSYASLARHLALLQRIAMAEGHPIETLEFQPLLLKAWQARVFAPAGGISAAPSMHVALATLCALSGLAVRRWLGLLLGLYAVLIWIGSIHFGWHYSVDGPIAALLMLLVWRIAGRIADAAEPASAEAGPLSPA